MSEFKYVKFNGNADYNGFYNTEEKLNFEIAYQLKRIADALEKTAGAGE